MKQKKLKRINPIAYELYNNPLFKPKRVKDPMVYTRKEKHKNNDTQNS